MSTLLELLKVAWVTSGTLLLVLFVAYVILLSKPKPSRRTRRLRELLLGEFWIIFYAFIFCLVLYLILK